MILVIAAIVITLVLFYGSFRYLVDMIRYRLPPGPRPWPFVGNLLMFLDTSRMPWEREAEVARGYGGMWRIYYGQCRVVSLHTVELIQEALVNKSKFFSERPDPWLPGFETLPVGVISESGLAWTKLRRFAVKAMRNFGMGKNQMVIKIQDEVQHFVAELDSYNGRPFEPHKLLPNTVSNVICSLVFGKRFHYNDAKYQRLLAVIERFFRRPFEDNAIYFVFPFLRFFSSPIFVTELKTVKQEVGRMLDEAIKDHRQDFDADHIRNFPEMYIQAEMDKDTAFDDYDRFVSTMTDMFLAGTETTSTSINWTLLFLSKWPHLQQRCHEAIDQVIDSDRLPNLEDRPRLVYIDAVMCEVLRFASIAPIALFHTNGKTSSSIGGYDIPPWTVVMYGVWDVHHKQDYWKDPEAFRPERWIDEGGKLLTHSSHFMPFGVGPRACLEESLARAEYFIFIVSLLHRFNFSLHPTSRDVNINKGFFGTTHTPPKYEIVAQKRF